MSRAMYPCCWFALSVVPLVLATGCSAAPPDSDGAEMRTTSEALHDDSFAVAFADCTEIASITTIPMAEAKRVVPSSFVPAGDASGASLIVRVADCASVSVAGHRPEAGTVAQIGVLITAPDGTGDINNYTLYYYTTSAQLFERLRRLGVDAEEVPNISYELKPKVGPATAVSIEIRKPGRPAFTVDSAVVEPTADAIPFTANWWQTNGHRTVKMSTPIPAIRFGGATSTLRTARHGALGEILHAGVVTEFVALDSFNRFPGATMTVTRLP